MPTLQFLTIDNRIPYKFHLVAKIKQIVNDASVGFWGLR